MICHACGGPRLTAFPGFVPLPRVTSDCRAWPAGGQLAICPDCGLCQKVVDAAWRAEIERIYATYQLYHQTAGGTEQVIFDQTTGAAAPRSDLVLRALLARLPLPDTGSMLDLGCGTGPTLRAFSRLRPAWSLHGYDPHLPDRARVAQIPGVKAVHEGALDDVGGRFDVVTAVHVLEHVPDPLAFLRAARQLLGESGFFVAQVPHFPDSAFDLVVADHCSHFTLPTVDRLLRQAGLVPLLLSADQLPKEITIIARPGEPEPGADGATNVVADSAAIDRALVWLGALLDQAEATTSGPLGVFGTSIGGNWLQGRLGPRVDFFVDEDPGRSGTLHHARPVLRPDQVPSGGRVLVPLPWELARTIGARLGPRGYEFLLPPAPLPRV